jgi:enoyl-CoA hydratase/carnithine racemase
MTSSDLQIQRDGPVAIITLNRPAVLNALHRAMFRALAHGLDELARDATVRVLLLTGAGRAFSAGIDLHDVAGLLDGALTPEQLRAELAALQAVTRLMTRLPKPVIVAVNGLAVGAGAELAIAGDIRLAADTAYFEFAEVTRGLFATNGAMHRLPRLIGLGRATQLLLTGERTTAATAAAIGLVGAVWPAAELLHAAHELAHALARHAPIPLGLVKRVLDDPAADTLDGALQLEIEATLACLASDDLREGLQAFRERRAAVYHGR